MSLPAIPDIITIVGSSYFQPISDLIELLLRKPAPGVYPAGTSNRENGYAASITILLVAVLESYTARLRFLRNGDVLAGNKSTPEILKNYFPDLPTKEELIEVFLLRNLVIHNHIWHIDVSAIETKGTPTISTPKELGFLTNKHYDSVVDIKNRKTNKLKLNINPTAVDRHDVLRIFEIIWQTLLFMNSRSYSDTPLAGRAVRYGGKFRQFEELIDELSNTNVKSV